MERLARTASGARHLRWGREIHATISAHVAHDDLLTEPQSNALRSEERALGEVLGGLEGAVSGYRGWIDSAHVRSRAALRVANYLADEAQRATDGALRPHRDSIARFLPGGYARIFSGGPLSRVLRAGHAKTASYAREGASLLRTLPGSVGLGQLPDLTPAASRLEQVATRIDELLRVQLEEIDPQRRPLKLAVERAVLGLREHLEQMDARLRAHFAPAFIESLYPELGRGNKAVADEPDEDDDDSEDPPRPAA